MLDEIIEDITSFIFSINNFSIIPLSQRECIFLLHNKIFNFLKKYNIWHEELYIEHGYEMYIRNKRKKFRRRIATPDGLSVFCIREYNKELLLYIIYEHKNGKAAKSTYRQLLTYVLVQARKVNPKNYQIPLIFGLGIGYGKRVDIKIFAQRFSSYISICNSHCCYLLNLREMKKHFKEFDGSTSLRKFLMNKYRPMYFIDGGAEPENNSIPSICTL